MRIIDLHLVFPRITFDMRGKVPLIRASALILGTTGVLLALGFLTPACTRIFTASHCGLAVKDTQAGASK